MVLTTCLLCCKEVLKKTKKIVKRKFLDSLRLHVHAGSGGMGYPKCGGIGGNGGNVYVVGKEGCRLKNIVGKYPEKKVKASCGENSHRRCIVGTPGSDIIIESPLGVSVFTEAGTKLGEVDKDGERILIARGGLGGCKETGFSGQQGEKGIFIFDLKLIADVGLVGFPNAGKSTILSAISRAKPKIASYPFTTLHPQLGTIEYKDLRKITVADLPGLIEGAHINIGLGHRFLKHIERTRLLALMVDVGGFQLSPKHKPRNCLETIVLLNKELEMYREDLVQTPAILIVNKMDKAGSSVIFNEIQDAANRLEDVFQDVPENMRPVQAMSFQKIIGISALQKNLEEIEDLKETIRDILDSQIEYDIQEREKALLQKIEKDYREYGARII